MSSECRCHTDTNFCFYCEMYSPLERKHEEQTASIERVIKVLEESSVYHGKKYTNKFTDNRQYHLGYETGLDVAIDKLKGVLYQHDTKQIRSNKDNN